MKEAGRPRGRGPVPGFLRTDVGSPLHPGAAGMQRNGTDSEGVWVVDFPFVVGSERREREASRPALEGGGGWGTGPPDKRHTSVMTVGSVLTLPLMISFLAFSEIRSYQTHDFLGTRGGKGKPFQCLCYDTGRPGPFVSTEPTCPLHRDSHAPARSLAGTGLGSMGTPLVNSPGGFTPYDYLETDK